MKSFKEQLDYIIEHDPLGLLGMCDRCLSEATGSRCEADCADKSEDEVRKLRRFNLGLMDEQEIMDMKNGGEG